VIKDKRPLDKLRTVDRLLDFIKPLVADDSEAGAKEEPYEFSESQHLVSQLVHLVYHPTSLNMYSELLNKFIKVFNKGGTPRMKYTCPSSIFGLIKLS
jgi:hypothetical protein